MTFCTAARVAIVLLLGIAGTAAQSPIETRGAWGMVANGQDFALRTQGLEAPESTFSLVCRKEQQRFTFELKSPALAGRPSGEDIRIGFKVDDGDQTWFNLSTGPGGTVPIAHPTAFWIVHAALIRDGARNLTFTAGDHTWQFSLDGFAGLTEGLATHCGFELSQPLPAQPSRGR
jgi:hypothetical protein